MQNKKLVVKPEDLDVVGGKVTISSEELAEAIQDKSLDLMAEEEDEMFVVNIACRS